MTVGYFRKCIITLMVSAWTSHLLTSPVTWPFESQWAISYWWSIGPKSVSLTDSEIFGIKHIGVTTLTFLGHVTSSVTWPFGSQWVISYWWSIGPKSLSLTDSEILCPKHHVPIGTMLNRHCACAISLDMYPFSPSFAPLAINARWKQDATLEITSCSSTYFTSKFQANTLYGNRRFFGWRSLALVAFMLWSDTNGTLYCFCNICEHFGNQMGHGV